MKDIFRFCIILSAVTALFAGCSSDRENGAGEGENPITLNGVMTRVGTSGETVINITAFNDDGNYNRRYFDETPVTSAVSLDGTPRELTLYNPRYYPLGNQPVRLFAYSGTAANNSNRMILTAGNTNNHDFVLSNYGSRGTGPIDTAYDGEGTPGSSQNPANTLLFRHVMTQLDVVIEIDEDEDYPVDSPPGTFQFTMDDIFQTGTYSIFSKEPVEGQESTGDLATNSGTAKYQVKEGINYLVPNGQDLVGRNFTSLTVDNYIAEPADLLDFVVTPDPGGPSVMGLYPGYAYQLTVTLQRLQIRSIVIRQIDWQTTELDDEGTTYDPNSLTLNLTGGYDNTGEDLITKVVLNTDDKVYVGQYVEGGNGIQFVTLPADGTVIRADLYTAKGLMVSIPVSGEYTSNTLTLNLSPGGMIPVNPGTAYNAATNPWSITTPVQFMNVEKDMGASYRQNADIDLDALIYPAGEQFIGFEAFSGEYDGNGYFITNLDYISNGLFDSNSGIIRNVRLYMGNMDLSGSAVAGTICSVNSGVVVACLNELQVMNTTGIVGGIVGRNEAGGQVIACVNTGDILDGATVGGIVGYNANPDERSVAACLNTGMLNIDAEDYLGGIVGESVNSSQPVVATSFWLVGTAQRQIGSRETAVGSDNVDTYDSTDLNPEKMRNGLNDGEPNEERIMNKLEQELSTYFNSWYQLYRFKLDYEATGITWPAPVKI